MAERKKRKKEKSSSRNDWIATEIRNYLQKVAGLSNENQLLLKNEEDTFLRTINQKFLKHIGPTARSTDELTPTGNTQALIKDIPDLMFLSLVKEKNNLKSELEQIKTTYDEVLSLITHEFKNILGSIHGYNKMLEKKLKHDKNEQLYHNLIASDRLTQQLFHMSDSLLKMSLSEKGLLSPEYKLIDFAEDVLKPVEKDLSEQMKKKHMIFEKITKTSNFIIEGDEWLLDIVIRNLLLNALKYAKANSVVLIEMKSELNRFVVSIRNKCEKLPPNLCDGIFQKFRSRKIGSVKGGTGLGLYNVKNIVEIHGGEISCTILPDEWIEFTFSLPQIN